MKYIVHDKDGRILRTGDCPESMLKQQAHGAGEFVIEGVAGDERHRVIGGKLFDIPEAERPQPAAPTVEQLRRAAYPPIGDQLDAIWKGGQAAAEMKARIDAVKAKFPKG